MPDLYTHGGIARKKNQPCRRDRAEKQKLHYKIYLLLKKVYLKIKKNICTSTLKILKTIVATLGVACHSHERRTSSIVQDRDPRWPPKTRGSVLLSCPAAAAVALLCDSTSSHHAQQQRRAKACSPVCSPPRRPWNQGSHKTSRQLTSRLQIYMNFSFISTPMHKIACFLVIFNVSKSSLLFINIFLE